MGYYENKKKSLKNQITIYERIKSLLDGKIEEFNHFYLRIKKEINSFLDEKTEENRRLNLTYTKDKEAVIQMAKERQIGFPWLAKAYEEYFELQDKNIVNFLKFKTHPAVKASEVFKLQSQLRRKAERDKKIAEYLVEYYETICPFLLDLREEVEDIKQEDREYLKGYSKEELEDETTKYLTKEEYRKLPSEVRNQMALDRYWKRPKSKWHIGRCYERYVGFLYESRDFEVDYVGIFKGFEDLGRDLICKKGNDFVVIQCKNWAKFRTIYERHIFQFFGTVFKYKDDYPDRNVKAVFYATTTLSNLARRFGKELGINLVENHKFDMDYPCIKCNVSRIDGSRIYHLPFDQQYDTTKVEKERGEFYCKTVKQAEDAGFRKAFRYSGLKKG